MASCTPSAAAGPACVPPPRSAVKTAPGYIELPSTPSLDIREQITLAAWVYRLGWDGTAIGKWYQKESYSYVLHMPGAGFHLYWDDHSQANISNIALPFLEWVHYAGTYDGHHMRVYVNGELVAERQEAGKHINSTANPVWIGASGYMDRTPGLIDDVQIWNVARTQEEIRQSMRDGLGGDEPGLVAWFPMDDEPLRDRSPHGNQGRLQGEAAIHAAGIPVDRGHAPDQVLWLPTLRTGESAE